MDVAIYKALSDEPKRPGRPRCRRLAGGFSLTELLIVIGVIVVILLIGIPAFNAMTIESRYGSAEQSLSATLSRAAIAAQSERNLVALRFLPAEWDADSPEDVARIAGRQKVVTYRYVTSTDALTSAGTWQVAYSEAFKRVEDADELLLPPDLWIAPGEALADPTPSGDEAHILNGVYGPAETAFSRSWDGSTPPGWSSAGPYHDRFLDADDFMVVFDSRGGLMRGPSLGADASSVELVDHNPAHMAGGPHIDRLSRRYFGSLVLYQREAFRAAGNSTDSETVDARRDYLLREGRPFYVGRRGGALISGTAPSQ